MTTATEEVKDKLNEAKLETQEAIEEVAVRVNEVAEKAESSANALFEGLRQLVLASIGAVALTRDEIEAFIRKLIERGEIAQKDGEKLLKEFQAKFRQRNVQAEEAAEKVESRVESSIEQLLNRLNIPSKRDIDELSAKIAQLTVRVEELRKAQK